MDYHVIKEKIFYVTYLRRQGTIPRDTYVYSRTYRQRYI